jgi:hypothetical protein
MFRVDCEVAIWKLMASNLESLVLGEVPRARSRSEITATARRGIAKEIFGAHKGLVTIAKPKVKAE